MVQEHADDCHLNRMVVHEVPGTLAYDSRASKILTLSEVNPVELLAPCTVFFEGFYFFKVIIFVILKLSRPHNYSKHIWTVYQSVLRFIYLQFYGF